MDWFRHYHGLATDPKLTAAAVEAGVHHTMAVAAWCYVLEAASESADRGSVHAVTPKIMAIGLRLERAEAERLLAAFVTEGLLSGERVANWQRRQAPSDSSRERVQRHRSVQKGQKCNVTTGPGNGFRPDDAEAAKGQTVTPVDRNVTKPQSVTDVTLQGANVTAQSRADLESESKLAAAESLPPREARAAAAAADFSDLAEQLAGKTGCSVMKASSLISSWCKQLEPKHVRRLVTQALAEADNPVGWLRKLVKSCAAEIAQGRIPERLQEVGHKNGSHGPGPLMQRLSGLGYDAMRLGQIGHANYQPLLDLAPNLTDVELADGLRWLADHPGMRWRSSARQAA